TFVEKLDATLRQHESYTSLSTGDRNAVIGYVRLAASNIFAIEAFELNRKSAQPIHGGVPKNYTLALSRTPFPSDWAGLPNGAKNYLAQPRRKDESLLPVIRNLLLMELKNEKGMEYGADVFDQRGRAQSHYFGGMEQLGVEPVGPASGRTQGVPVEMRHLGED